MESFSALLALCAGDSPVTSESPSQRPVTRSFDMFFDLCLNKRLTKQSWGWYLRRYRAHYDVTVLKCQVIRDFANKNVSSCSRYVGPAMIDDNVEFSPSTATGAWSS